VTICRRLEPRMMFLDVNLVQAENRKSCAE
jgi:hypothetical protein